MSANRGQNQTNLSRQMDEIDKLNEKMKQSLSQQQIEKKLLDKIGLWEKDSISKIQSAAKNVRTELQQVIKDSSNRLNTSITKISNEIRSKRRAKNWTQGDIEQLKIQFDGCRGQWKQLNEVDIAKNDLSPLDMIKVVKTRATKNEMAATSPSVHNSFANGSETDFGSNVASETNLNTSRRIDPSNHISMDVSSATHPFPSTTFNLDFSPNKHLRQLFEHLRFLPAMNKTGTMSGDCDRETTQMESFLMQNFNFKNNSGEYIVQGVKSFRLGKPPISMNPNNVIYFPNENRNSFAMTIQEILQWQSSYEIYADKDVKDMTTKFLHGALQGVSKYGEEAFRMKFVVRISQCPILMEFDAHIIPRQLEHTWPHRIKLVSVTGVDFAGRIHDINDITTYVSNWQQIYELDPKSGHPLVFNGRDFHAKKNAPHGQLRQEYLLKDLIRMARLRLRACDKEKVQIVVETGIGLGVFAGRHIGIDDTVRELSAHAIRRVLEEDGASYKNILAVIFALPIFDGDIQDGRRRDVYHAFVNEFEKERYEGCVPVMIADQDMHRLTVAIAINGFIVSELNPADSHGVFGEYWQNRGPAVEEKLALTTLGLLVQHHLINPYVLDPAHYNFV